MTRRYHVLSSWDSPGGRVAPPIAPPVNTRAEAFAAAERALAECERRGRAGVVVAVFDNRDDVTWEIRAA